MSEALKIDVLALALQFRRLERFVLEPVPQVVELHYGSKNKELEEKDCRFVQAVEKAISGVVVGNKQ